MLLQGSDIVVRTLIEQGCDVVFGYPGAAVIDIYDALYEHADEIHHVLVAHEQGAAHAADGYARASGRVGVCMATSGPGCCNLVTGIATAFLDSVPLVAITGNVATGQIGTDSFQEIDITGITLPITKHNYFVDRVEDLAATVREAFLLARSGRPGPVLVDVAKDVQLARCEWHPQEPLAPEEPPMCSTAELERIAKIINASERPYVYFGGGVVASGARDELLELARVLKAPMGCSLMGVSAIPSDTPGFLGMEGMHGHYASSMAMKEADCIVALGVRFNDRSTGDRAKFARGARMIHVDVDDSELSKTVPGTCDVHGDVRRVLQGVIPLLEHKERPAWDERVTRLVADEALCRAEAHEMSAAAVMRTLQKHLEPTTPVVTDVGQHQMFAAQELVFSRPRTFITSGGLGTMGFGLGASIGAYFATGERPVLVIGDGGFGMCLTELATAVSNDVPVTVLVCNNGVLGMVRQWQTMFYDGRHSQTTLDRKTNFVAVAQAFGAQGEKVGTQDELDQALARARKAGGPYVIDCPLDPDELVLPMLPPGGSMNDIIVKAGA